MENDIQSAILNAAWKVRACRAFQHAQRAEALAAMLAAVRRAMELQADPEAVLYAVAIGLYDRRDHRFTV